VLYILCSVGSCRCKYEDGVRVLFCNFCDYFRFGVSQHCTFPASFDQDILQDFGPLRQQICKHRHFNSYLLSGQSSKCSSALQGGCYSNCIPDDEQSLLGSILVRLIGRPQLQLYFTKHTSNLPGFVPGNTCFRSCL